MTKTVGAQTTVMVYDALGRLAAEYGGTTSVSGRQYVTVDHLGSTRLVSNADGGTLSCSDYVPFGEEIGVAVGSRPACYGGNGGVKVKFTGKERDAETANSGMGDGLDYFGARYYAAVMGRWTSPDRINVTNSRLLSPSNTLNKYVYAANNPLKYVDLDGQDITLYYRRGSFLNKGHVVIGALNQQTGKVGFLDFIPAREPTYLGVLTGRQYGAQVNTLISPDRLREHASLTIQTTPEEAQKVLDMIRKFESNPPDWQGLGPNCSTACSEALRILGFDVSALTPDELWNYTYAAFSQEAVRGRQNLGNPFFAPIAPSAQPGAEYGNPRYSGPGFDYSRFLFQLWVTQQSKHPRACVTVYGPDGPSTTCE